MRNNHSATNMLVLLFAVLLFGATCSATNQCSASTPCTTCNSGYFTVRCECRAPSSNQSCSCTSLGCCAQCCITNPPSGGNTCTKSTCGGSICAGCSQSPTGIGGTDALNAQITRKPPTLLLAQSGNLQDLPPFLDSRVSVGFNPGLGVELENPSYSISQEELSEATVDVRNISGRTIRALALIWTVNAEGAPQPASILTTWDSASEVNPGLRAGESRQIVGINGSVVAKGRIGRVDVDVVYVEYDDGEALGPMRSEVSAQLSRNRFDERTALLDVQEQVSSGGTVAQIEQYLGSKIDSSTGLVRSAYFRARAVLQLDGIPGLSRYIEQSMKRLTGV